MKKLIVLISMGLVISCVPPITLSAKEKVNEKSVKESMEIDNYIVSFNIDNDKVVYNVDAGSVAVNGEIKAYIVTTVSDFDTSMFTEEELLEVDKQNTIDQFKNYMVGTSPQSQSADNKGVIKRSYGASIPSNASYVSAGTFRKEISEIAGELSEGLSVLSEIANRLSGIPIIPHSALLLATSVALNVSSAALGKYRGSITAVWTYQMHRTKSTYTVGITKQYGYRYANNGLNYKVRTPQTTVSLQKNNNSKGNWWVTQKPF